MSAISSPRLTNHVVTESKGEEEKLASSATNPFSNRTDLSALIKKFTPSLQKNLAPRYIAQSIYEAAPRNIRGARCGQAFPMNPEVLSYAMDLAKDNYAMEIGGASGENAILLAYAGAKKVYLNDLEKVELNIFNQYRKELPELKNLEEPIEGSCLDLIEKRPDLKGRIDVILCRNLIHFFKDEEQHLFFQNIRALLSDTGRAIVSVNAKYRLAPQKDLFAQNPQHTSFKQTLCVISDIETDQRVVPYIKFSPCSSEEVTGGFKEYRIYDRDPKKGGKWVVDNTAFQQIDDKEVKEGMKKAIQDNKAWFSKLKNASVRCLEIWIRVYSAGNLRDLFKENGFEVEGTFVVKADGHLIEGSEDDFYAAQATQVGVLVKKSSDNKVD